MLKRRSFARARAQSSLGVENLEQRELLTADLLQPAPFEAGVAVVRGDVMQDFGAATTQSNPRENDDNRDRTQRQPRGDVFDFEFDFEPEDAGHSIDGTGNNQQQPEWGGVGATLIRMADAEFEDGVSAPAGSDRPSARVISNALSEDDGLVSEDGLSAMVYVWGQFIDHDISLTPAGGTAMHIEVPAGDPHFDPFNTGTVEIPFNRAVPIEAANGVALDYPNVITAWIDGSGVYGSDDATATALRTMEGGKLKTSDGELLPRNNATTFPSGTLAMDNDANIVPDDALFAAGDVRANENIELTSLHTLFVREHNRLADRISKADPTLADEAIYQQARALVIAQLQAITYNDWLPSILGERGIDRYDGYDPAVNPNIAIEFSTAAFRFGHSLLGDDVEFLNNVGEEIAEEVPLSDAFSNPSLVRENGIDSIIKYLASDPSSELDLQTVDSVRNFLFGPPGAGGLDLPSLNIQRGRDVGLADYNSTREAYGLRPLTSFAEITQDSEIQQKLESLYGSIDNIDLWVGGLAEDHVRGASLGETFQAIIGDQFQRIRDGDRYWYQNVFSGDTLRSLESTTLADVIERNTQLTDLQDDVFFFQASISGRVTVAEGAGLEGHTVELLADGDVISSAVTDDRGRYSFDVIDGLRTGEYQVRWLSEDPARPLLSETVAITTGDTHVRHIDFVVPVADGRSDDGLTEEDERRRPDRRGGRIDPRDPSRGRT